MFLPDGAVALAHRSRPPLQVTTACNNTMTTQGLYVFFRERFYLKLPIRRQCFAIFPKRRDPRGRPGFALVFRSPRRASRRAGMFQRECLPGDSGGRGAWVPDRGGGATRGPSAASSGGRGGRDR